MERAYFSCDAHPLLQEKKWGEDVNNESGREETGTTALETTGRDKTGILVSVMRKVGKYFPLGKALTCIASEETRYMHTAGSKESREN